MSLHIVLTILATGLFLVPAHAQLPTAVGWTALPQSTSLDGSGACPPDNFGGDPYLFSRFCANVIRSWSGAIADTTANRLLIWGGGHVNYYGNEIYSLNLTANPITLTRIKDPTIPSNFANQANCIDGIPPGNPDFAPNSRESYGGMAFIPGQSSLGTTDQMYIEGGSLACQLGDGSTNTWTIPLTNLSNASQWKHMNPTITGPQPTSGAGYSYGNIAAYDPNSGLLFVSDSSSIYTYNFKTNTYNRISAANFFVTSIYLSGAVDPVNKLFIMVGGCDKGVCPSNDGVFVADISNPTTTTQQNWTAATLADPVCGEFLSGGANPISASNPGFVYDPVAKNFVGWPDAGNNVYTLTPDPVNKRLTCQRLTFPSPNANGPPNSSYPDGTPNVSTGTFGRFNYFPALDVFVLVNDWNIPAYILRLRPANTFTMSATPPTASVNAGGSATYTITTTAVNGFTGPVNLSVGGLPPGATFSFNPSTVTAGGTATLSVTTATGSSSGSSALTITGTSGTIVQTANVTLNVMAPDFAIAAGPGIESVDPGASATYTVSTSAIDGFMGTIGLSVSGLPNGATSSLNPNSVTVGNSSTLTVNVPAGATATNSTLTVTGTSGSLSHNVNTIVNVTDFGIAVTPASNSTTPGGTASYSVSTTALNGFTGSLNLSVSGLPAGATFSFNPSSVTAGSGSTLSITTASGTPLGSSNLTITGTSGTLSHSANTNLNVSTVSSSAGVVSIDFVGLNTTPMGSSEIAGVVPASNWNDAGGAKSSAPLALVDQNGNSTTATVTWTSDDIWDETITDQPGNARMMKGYLDNGNQNTSIVTVSGLPSNAGGFNIYVYAQGDGGGGATNTGIYQISGAGITTASTALTYNSNFNGTFTQATASNANGNYVVFTIPNVSGFTLSAIPSVASNGFQRAALNGLQIVPVQMTSGFTLSATPGSASVNPGSNATYTVNVNPLGSFTGAVGLAVSGLPSGATASFSANSITTSGSSALTVSIPAGSSASSSTLTITGTSGSLLQTAHVTLNVTVPDFALGTTPGSATVSAGGSATYTINTTAQNGFAGMVNLSVSGQPSGATVSFSSNPITAGASPTLTVTTASSTPAGTSTLTITGMSGALSHSATVTLTVNSVTSIARAISIDFVGLNASSMGSSEVAGVVPVSNWNNATGAKSSSPLALVDQNGNATTATATWTADDIWNESITEQPGNARMMKGYLDNGGQNTTVLNVTGLPSNANGFKVYVYAQGGSGNATNTGIYQVSGTGITTASTALTYSTVFNGTFTTATAGSPNGNYVVFAIPNVSGFTLSAIPSTASNGFQRAPVNGLQIVPQ